MHITGSKINKDCKHIQNNCNICRNERDDQRTTLFVLVAMNVGVMKLLPGVMLLLVSFQFYMQGQLGGGSVVWMIYFVQTTWVVTMCDS